MLDTNLFSKVFWDPTTFCCRRSFPFPARICTPLSGLREWQAETPFLTHSSDDMVTTKVGIPRKLCWTLLWFMFSCREQDFYSFETTVKFIVVDTYISPWPWTLAICLPYKSYYSQSYLY